MDRNEPRTRTLYRGKCAAHTAARFLAFIGGDGRGTIDTPVQDQERGICDCWRRGGCDSDIAGLFDAVDRAHAIIRAQTK